MTLSGICGQANVGHAFFRDDIAKAYLEYWNRLKYDPKSGPTKDGNDAQCPTELIQKPGSPLYSYQPFFSPRRTKSLLDRFKDKDTLTGEVLADSCLGDLLMNARPGAPVFISLPFGIGDEIYKYIKPQRDGNKYLLLNTKWQGASQGQKDNYFDIIKDPRAYVAVGDIEKYDDPLGRWHEEINSGLSSHVLYIHNKMMIIDPFGPEPVVVTGSANFSESSMIKNDENLIVIRNKPEVAYVYLTEFMRLWTHYKSRNVDNWMHDKHIVRPEMEMNDAWTEKYFDGESQEYYQREAFAGSEKMAKGTALAVEE